MSILRLLVLINMFIVQVDSSMFLYPRTLWLRGGKDNSKSNGRQMLTFAYKSEQVNVIPTSPLFYLQIPSIVFFSNLQIVFFVLIRKLRPLSRMHIWLFQTTVVR